jgi:hypothetical protein
MAAHFCRRFIARESALKNFKNQALEQHRRLTNP